MSRAKSSGGSGDLFDIATGPNCCESTGRPASRAPYLYARAYVAVIRIAGLRSMLPDPLFLNGPDSPTPRARTYADHLCENSCEVTLVAESALRGHIR